MRIALPDHPAALAEHVPGPAGPPAEESAAELARIEDQMRTLGYL